MQLVDLRRPQRPGEPALEVWASPGAELVRALSTLVDPECDGFDVGEERLDELRSRMDPALLESAQAVFPEGKHWLFISSIVVELAAPGTVDDLFELLRDDPGIAWRVLLASHLDDGQTAALADAVLEGRAGVDEVTAAMAGVDDWHVPHVEAVLAVDPEALGRALLDVLVAFHDGIGADMLAEAMGPMARETAARLAQRDAGTPIGRLVVEATNGYELRDGLASERVLLLPSYWFRPWLVISHHSGSEVFTTPIADEHLALPSQAPSPALVKLFKALGDEGRLRLLRAMATGPISLTDAMHELDVAKTTAHHHLSILRQAGLVTVRDRGRSKAYGLRQDPPAAAAAALTDYVGRVARTVLSVAE